MSSNRYHIDGSDGRDKRSLRATNEIVTCEGACTESLLIAIKAAPPVSGAD
jgi:hypothetical protein